MAYCVRARDISGHNYYCHGATEDWYIAPYYAA